LASFHKTVVEHLPSYHIKLVRLYFAWQMLRGSNCFEVHSPLHQTRQRQSIVSISSDNRYQRFYRPPPTLHFLSSTLLCVYRDRLCHVRTNGSAGQVATKGITL